MASDRLVLAQIILVFVSTMAAVLAVGLTLKRDREAAAGRRDLDWEQRLERIATRVVELGDSMWTYQEQNVELARTRLLAALAFAPADLPACAHLARQARIAVGIGDSEPYEWVDSALGELRETIEKRPKRPVPRRWWSIR